MSQFSNKKYDLEERTAKFGEVIIQFCKPLQQDTISKPLVGQLIRFATNIGANCMEANGASSKKDFRNKIFICKKEAQETKHWLRMLFQYFSNKKTEGSDLHQECQELTMIFQKITNFLNKKMSHWFNENLLEIKNWKLRIAVL